MNDPRDFSAPWCLLLKMTTTAACIVCFAVAALGLYWVMRGALLAGCIILGVPLAIVFLSMFFMVRSYRIEDGQLKIRRLGWDTVYDLGDLKAVESGVGRIRGSFRLWGNGGLCSFTGWFTNSAIGNYRAYATDFDKAVVLRFPKETLVITPGNPSDFMASLGPRS